LKFKKPRPKSRNKSRNRSREKRNDDGDNPNVFEEVGKEKYQDYLRRS